MESIRWPEDYLPGLTDNFVSNEVIVQGLSVEDVWEQLANPHHWPEYYENASDIRLSRGCAGHRMRAAGAGSLRPSCLARLVR